MPEFDPENTVSDANTFQGRLVRLRDLYSNRIPSEVIHSNNPDNRFKVRKGWFIGLFHSIESYTERRGHVLDPEVNAEYKDFRAGFVINGLTTVNEINRANILINSILGVPEDTGVPYDRVLSSVVSVLDGSKGRAILRWQGVSQDEIVSRLPNYHYSHTYDLWLKYSTFTPPLPEHEGWVIAGYSNAYQGEKRDVSSSELCIQSEIKRDVETWSMASEGDKRLLVLAQTLPNPYIFIDPSFPWHDGPFQHPPYPLWTVAFDGYSQVSLTKHNLEVSRSEARWTDEKVMKS